MLDINECADNMCVASHTANCLDGVNSFTCDCVLGYDGRNCENSIYKYAIGTCNRYVPSPIICKKYLKYTPYT